MRALTIRGRAVLAGGLSAVVCALVLGQSDLLRVGILLAVLPVLCAIYLSRTRFRVSCTRTLAPHRVEAGAPARVHLELANVSTSRCTLMLVEERVPYILGVRPRFVLPGLGGGERRAVAYTVRSEVRGRFTVGPLSVRLTDPFGLVQLARSFTARDELVVTPRVYARPGLPWRGDWGGRGDTRPRAVAASGEDDVATREYRHGDDLRRVHWRSTARRGELMVRREEQPWQSRASILLDRRTIAHRGEGAASSMEWAITAAASVAHHLVRLGYVVRLVDGEIAHPWTDPAGEGAGPILDALAVVQAGGPSSLGEAMRVARQSQTGGLLVAIVGALDVETTTELTRLRRQGTSCVAIVIDSPTYAAGAAPSSAAPDDGAPDQSPAARAVQLPLVTDARSGHERTCQVLRDAGWAVTGAARGDRVPQVWERLRTDEHVLTVNTR